MGAKKQQGQAKKGPPGKVKLAGAMRKLLETKDFSSITTDEISKTAKTNEALIYRYFGDKRGLLHSVLGEYLEESHDSIIKELNGVDNSLEKLTIIIKGTFESYDRQSVFAKILLIEARNFPGFFESDTYKLVKRYTRLVLDTIKEGVAKGEIRDDVAPETIRDTIIGAIEHNVLPSLFFERTAEPDILSADLFSMILEGISTRR